jgi:hypothetical protein
MSLWRWAGVCLAALAALFARTERLAAESITIAAAADAMVIFSQPDSNFGGAGGLGVAAAGSPNGEFQSLLRFDASAAKTAFDAAFGPGQWSIESAVLQLTAIAPNNPVFNPLAPGQLAAGWLANDGWIEGTGIPANPTTNGVTANGLASFLGPNDQALGTFAYDGGLGVRSFSLGLPAELSADLAAGSLVGLLLSPADESVSMLPRSRNFPNAVERPQLILVAVPEPEGLALAVVAGQVVLAFLASRRSAARVS